MGVRISLLNCAVTHKKNRRLSIMFHVIGIFPPLLFLCVGRRATKWKIHILKRKRWLWIFNTELSKIFLWIKNQPACKMTWKFHLCIIGINKPHDKIHQKVPSLLDLNSSLRLIYASLHRVFWIFLEFNYNHGWTICEIIKG